MDVVEIAISLGSLAFSVLALSAAAFCVLRGAPAQLEAHAREAVLTATTARTHVDAVIAQVTSTLEAIQEERERAIRAQRRASADRNKVEAAEGDSGAPMSRDQMLAGLRRQAGLI